MKNHFFLLFIGLLLGFAQPTFSQDSTDSLTDSTLMESAITEPAVNEVETLPVVKSFLFDSTNFKVILPEVMIQSVESEIKVEWQGEDPEVVEGFEQEITVGDSIRKLAFENGVATFTYPFRSTEKLTFAAGDDVIYETPIRTLPLWLSILPPLIAIALALIFREVITSLLVGIFSGAAILHVYISGVMGIGKGLLAVLDTYLLNALADSSHLSVILFSMLIGALVAVISKNGGMQGVVNGVAKYANNAKSGQIATWFLGVAIFFDDYANTLIVGNTMRPVTDRLRISREKLSYIVDSTAAPVAAIAFVTTWIGAELGYIKDGIDKVAVDGFDMPDPYSIFVSSLQYSFYPIFTLAFMLMLILRNRDFGPMWKAEMRARKTGQVSAPKKREALDKEKAQELDDLEPVRGATPRAFNAIIPIAVMIVGTVVGLMYTGIDAINADAVALAKYEGLPFSQKISAILGSADSYAALLWSSMSALVVALGLTLVQKIMKLEELMESVTSGFKTMMGAMIILICAWALAKVTDDLHTSDFLIQALGNGMAPFLIPVITFILAGLVSFSTGSSWSTMAILYPLLIPVAFQVGDGALTPEQAETVLPILYNTVACVLAGSVLGDHCSPISDTTILSSLATSTNHIDHVRTQLPYALTVGTVSIVIGILPGALGVPFWITFPVGIAALYLIVQFFGKKVEVAPAT